MIEDLSLDRNGKPPIKPGPNRGFRKPEPRGISWINMGGYCP